MPDVPKSRLPRADKAFFVLDRWILKLRAPFLYS